MNKKQKTLGPFDADHEKTNKRETKSQKVFHSGGATQKAKDDGCQAPLNALQV